MIEVKKILLDKIRFEGVEALTDEWLISIIIGKGTLTAENLAVGESLIKKYNSLDNLLLKDVTTLKKECGLTQAQATLLSAIGELSRRQLPKKEEKISHIKSKDDVYKIFKPIIGNLNHEEFWAILLNSSNRILDKICIAKGGIDTTTVDVRIVIKSALDKLASNIIIVHNHPSGSLEPSVKDIEITKTIEDAGNLFDILLLDHLIITSNGYESIKK